MIFYKSFIIVPRDRKALFYHPQPCSEKLGNEARQVTKLLQFLETKWPGAPCGKGPPSRALTDYDSGQRLKSISLPAVFE